MISFQPSFIPLYFDEAEQDLWMALEQIEPEKRSTFIKEVLRQVLLKDHHEKQQDLVRDPELEFDFESLTVDSPIMSNGYKHILYDIIGTEDDEKILKVLRGNK